MQQAMAIQHGVAQACITHPLVQALVVGAFRQPDAEWSLADESLMFTHSGAELPPHRFRMLPQQREVAVRCSAGEQIDDFAALQGCKPSDQICVAGFPSLQMTLHGDRQVVHGVPQPRISFRQQVQSRLDPGREAPLQISIRKKRQQGWREPDRDLRRSVRVCSSVFKTLKQGEVALDQGLEEPVLLQRARLCRSHVGQVSVQNKGDRSLAHRPINQWRAECNPICSSYV